MPDERSPLLKDSESQRPQPLGITQLLAGLVGVFLASADKYILLTTQNQIASALHSPSNASLLLVSYNLGFCVALPVYGFLSDIYGSRNFLLISYVLFSIGCAISGVVDSLWPFAFGRFLAGIGGSGMTDLLSVLINEVFDVSEIASVRSYVVAVEIFGQGCGGPLGGIVTDKIGWRWALLGQAPIGMICLILAYKQLPQGHSARPASEMSLWSFDYLGLGAFIISATAFVLGTTNGSLALDKYKPALFTASAVFLIILILIELVTPRPIIPISIITAPGLRNIFLGQFLFHGNVSTIMSNLSPYLGKIDRLTSSEIALRIWPSTLGLIIGAMVSGRVLKSAIKYRKLSVVGVGICVVSSIVMTIRWIDGIKGIEIFYGFPWAVGGGILLSAQFLALTIWSSDRIANSTAIYFLSQQIGQIVGTSGSAAALQKVFSNRLGVNFADVSSPVKNKIIQKILEDFDTIADLPVALQNIVQFSYIEAFRLIPALATTLTVLSAILICLT